MRQLLLGIFCAHVMAIVTPAGPYAPAAEQPGSEAIGKDDARFVAWATDVVSLNRGPLRVDNPGLGSASFGIAAEALGPATGSPSAVVSLGDGGSITLGFAQPITDGPGFDFAVFENSFADNFLELAFVEVSSDGINFFRFGAVSLTPVVTQLGGFDPIDPTNIDNLAGKYRGGFGTPFDLAELVGASNLLDVRRVTQVRIVDVVGSLDPSFGTLDSLGNKINDPWPTPFASSGFDLDGVGALHVVPEANAIFLVGTAIACAFVTRQSRRRPGAPQGRHHDRIVE